MRTRSKKLTSLILVLVMMIGVFLTPREVKAAEPDNITINNIGFGSGRDTRFDGMIAAHPWLFNSHAWYQFGGNEYLLSFASGNNTIETSIGPKVNFQLVTETFKDANGNWVFCYDRGTPAEGSRYLMGSLPSGYTLKSEAELKELSNVISALFPDSKDSSVLAANIGNFVASEYQAQARQLFNDYGEYAAVTLMQGLAYWKVHDIASVNQGPLRRPGFTGIDPKTGKWTDNPATEYYGVGNTMNIINFPKMYELGLRLTNTGATEKCYEASLTYGEEKSFTGEIAEAIKGVHSAGLLPDGITFKDNGSGVSLKSNIKANKSFDPIKTEPSMKGVYSSSSPYASGSSGQLIVRTYLVKSVCLKINNTGIGSARVKKSVDPACAEIVKNNPMYSLNGTTIEVYSDVALKNKIGTLVTDVNGDSKSIDLDPGVYYAKEVKAGKGYQLNPTPVKFEVKAGETTSIEIVNKPKGDPLTLLLRKVNNDNKPLEGAVFEVTYYAGYLTLDETKTATPSKTWIFKTGSKGSLRFKDFDKTLGGRISGDELIKLNGEEQGLMGTYVFKEVKAPTGYKLDSNPQIAYLKENEKDISVGPVYNTPTIPNKIQKAQFTLLKEHGDTPLEGAIFELYDNLDNLVETLKTDKNGRAIISELPFGEYTLKETQAPEGYVKIYDPIKLVINGDDSGNYLTNNIQVDGPATIQDKLLRVHNDELPTMQTSLFQINDNDSELERKVPKDEKDFFTGEKVNLIDRVTMMNLVEGQDYILKARLRIKDGTETGTAFNPNGQEIIEHKFTFDGSEYEDVMIPEFEVPEELIGKELVAFEELYLIDRSGNEHKIVTHEDINDKDQTIYVKEPTIGTKASTNEVTQMYEDKITEIKDEIRVKNLIIGKEYTIKGILMNKETGETLLMDDQPVTSELKFIAEEENPTKELTFKIDGKLLTTREIVVFEDLYHDGIKIASHADLEDEAQTVNLPMILNVKIAKADSKDVKFFLKGAEITIFKADGSIAKDIYGKDCVGVTNKDGKVEFIVQYEDGLYAQETSAPEGYHLNPKKFMIKPVDGLKLETDLIGVNILDEAIVIPPPTGIQENTPALILVGSLLTLGLAGVILARKKREED